MTTEISPIDKFAFIGPVSVGKTTITRIMGRNFRGDSRVKIVAEAAKDFFGRHPDVTGSFASIQQRIQDLAWQRERAAMSPNTKLIIADRSVIDPIIYTQVYDTTRNADFLFQRVEEWLPTYTSFLLLDPTGTPDLPRPARLEKTADQRIVVYNAFGEFCIKHGLPYVEVSGNIQERADRVQQVIFERVSDKTIFENAQPSYRAQSA